ncbi:lipopolysaccharide biosynthesis protein [Fibrobacter sp.]
MGSAKKAFSGALWSVVVNIVNAVYGFIAIPVLIGYFGRSNYGLIGLASSVNAYMQLMDMGLNSTNVRFFSAWLAKGDEKKIDKLFRTCNAVYSCVGVINTIVLVVVMFFSNSIFNVTPDQDVVFKNLFLILIVTALFNWGTSCYNQLIIASENISWIQRRTLLTKLLMICVLLATVSLKLSMTQYFLLISIAPIIILPLTIAKIKREHAYVHFLPCFDKKTFCEILPYSLNIFSFSIFQFSFMNLRTVFLGIQGNTASVTDYNVMNGIASLVTMVGGVFGGVLLPSSTRVVQSGDRLAFERVAYQGTKFVSMILCFCAFGLIAIDKDLLILYVGEDFLGLLPWLNLWLVFTIANHNQCISSLILAGSDIRPLSYMSAFSSIVGLVTAWISIPYLHAGGAVLAFAVYCSCQALFFYTYYWPRKMNINSWKVFSKSLMPFVLMGVIVSSLVQLAPMLENHWLNMLVHGSGFAILFAALCWILLLNSDDKNFIQKVLKKDK